MACLKERPLLPKGMCSYGSLVAFVRGLYMGESSDFDGVGGVLSQFYVGEGMATKRTEQLTKLSSSSLARWAFAASLQLLKKTRSH